MGVWHNWHPVGCVFFLIWEVSVCSYANAFGWDDGTQLSSFIHVMAPLDNESPVQLQVGQNASSMGDVASYHVANPMAHHLISQSGLVQIILSILVRGVLLHCRGNVHRKPLSWWLERQAPIHIINYTKQHALQNMPGAGRRQQVKLCWTSPAAPWQCAQDKHDLPARRQTQERQGHSHHEWDSNGWNMGIHVAPLHIINDHYERQPLEPSPAFRSALANSWAVSLAREKSLVLGGLSATAGWKLIPSIIMWGCRHILL